MMPGNTLCQFPFLWIFNVGCKPRVWIYTGDVEISDSLLIGLNLIVVRRKFDGFLIPGCYAVSSHSVAWVRRFEAIMLESHHV